MPSEKPGQIFNTIKVILYKTYNTYTVTSWILSYKQWLVEKTCLI